MLDTHILKDTEQMLNDTSCFSVVQYFKTDAANCRNLFQY